MPIVTKQCRMCGRSKQMRLSDSEMTAYTKFQIREGHIQDVLPELNPAEREFLMSGMCPDCQELLFGTKHDTGRITDVEQPTKVVIIVEDGMVSSVYSNADEDEIEISVIDKDTDDPDVLDEIDEMLNELDSKTDLVQIW